MLKLLGNTTRLCDGIPRREVLRVGGMGAFGLSAAGISRLRAAQAAEAGSSQAVANAGLPGFGKAKSCILLFPYGSPPQHETFDPKPEAPVEIRGELGTISSVVPGLSICERLPEVAQVLDRCTVVRSVTHPYPLHCVAYSATGNPDYDVSLETRPRDLRHWPFLGSIVGCARERSGDLAAGMPGNIGLPWLLNSKSDIAPLAGPYAAFLGQRHDPFWPTFNGRGTRVGPHLSDAQTRDVVDPYAGCTPEGRFEISDSGQAGLELELSRLGRRRDLLRQFDTLNRRIDKVAREGQYDRHQQLAFSLLADPRLRKALDVTQEPLPVRERYGLTLFGQSCLAARRLVEAGCPFVTVFWDAYEIFAGCAWDTHANHFPRLKEYLLPGMDLAMSALIGDLTERGLLDETLVVWMSEHGRTPQIDSKPKGAGRHHWSRAYSVALAGGGVAAGRVVGSTDPTGGEVADTPVSPKDLLATTLHLLGIDPHWQVPSWDGRPLPVAGSGVVRPELIG
ncbi:MAG: DUF1501 domain-containing protein [Planctomycetaceae bacterium]